MIVHRTKEGLAEKGFFSKPDLKKMGLKPLPDADIEDHYYVPRGAHLVYDIKKCVPIGLRAKRQPGTRAPAGLRPMPESS